MHLWLSIHARHTWPHPHPADYAAVGGEQGNATMAHLTQQALVAVAGVAARQILAAPGPLGDLAAHGAWFVAIQGAALGVQASLQAWADLCACHGVLS